MTEEKTKGNLEEDESSELAAVLTELQSRFVQITQLLAQQAAQPAMQEGSGTPSIIAP